MTSRTGSITRDGDLATITFERRLPHAIEAVWAAITDPDQRAKWFGATTIDGRAGGTIEMTADGPPAPASDRRMEGRILVWDPPRTLEHEWNQTLVGKTVVRYQLTPDGDGTILRIEHRLFDLRTAQGYIPGQHAYLDRLEALLAGTELPQWWQRYGEVKAAYA